MSLMDTIKGFFGKAKDAAGDVADKAQDVAGDVVDKVQEVAGDVKDKVTGGDDAEETEEETATEEELARTSHGVASVRGKSARALLKPPPVRALLPNYVWTLHKEVLTGLHRKLAFRSRVPQRRASISKSDLTQKSHP